MVSSILAVVAEGARRKAVDAGNRAQAAEAQARQQALQSWQNQYVSDIGLAYRFLHEGQLDRCEEILQLYSTPPGDLPDIRSFEWEYLWRLCQGDARFTFAPQLHPVDSVTLSSDGQWLATTSSRGVADRSASSTTLSADLAGELILYAAATRQRITNLEQGLSPATAAAFAPNKPLLAAGHADGSVSLWSGNQFQQHQVLEGAHADAVRVITFSTDGKLLASGSLDGTVVIREAGTGKVIRELDAEETQNGQVWDLDFDPSGEFVGICGTGPIKLVSLTGGDDEIVYVPGRGWTRCLDFSPTGDLLAVGRVDTIVAIVTGLPENDSRWANIRVPLRTSNSSRTARRWPARVATE